MLPDSFGHLKLFFFFFRIPQSSSSQSSRPLLWVLLYPHRDRLRLHLPQSGCPCVREGVGFLITTFSHSQRLPFFSELPSLLRITSCIVAPTSLRLALKYDGNHSEDRPHGQPEAGAACWRPARGWTRSPRLARASGGWGGWGGWEPPDPAADGSRDQASISRWPHL